MEITTQATERAMYAAGLTAAMLALHRGERDERPSAGPSPLVRAHADGYEDADDDSDEPRPGGAALDDPRGAVEPNDDEPEATLKVSVTIADESRSCSLPEHERWIDVTGSCPSCEADSLRVIGDERQQDIGHDTVTAPALALCCGATVGTVRVTLGTIFGLEEDARVLHGRCRVY